MKKTLVTILLFVFVAGLLVGPGYLLYCSHFSGTIVAEPEMFSLDIAPVTIRGVTKRAVSGSDKPIAPVSLSLTPEMNPISVLLTGRYVRPTAGRKTTEYSVSMTLGDTPLWERDVRVTGKSSGKKNKKTVSLSNVKMGKTGLDSFSLHVNSFAVSEPGDYKLRVVQKGSPCLNHVVDMKAKVKKHVKIANRSIVLSGCVAFGIGLLGLVTIGIVNKRTRQE